MSERYALILVDVMGAFFDPAGSSYYPEAAAVLPNVEALLASARANDVFRVHAVERHHPDARDGEQQRIPVHCVIGSLDCEYVPSVAPQLSAREIEVPKIRYSSFMGTSLDMMLRAAEITAVVIVGVKTNVCIRATATDAFALGYRVIVPSDATNSNRPHLHAASLEDISRYMGSTPTTAEVLTQFGGAAA